jgi:CBS domain-containing protein
MQIKEVMTPSPEIISPKASLAEAATMMKKLNVGSLPVGSSDSIVGWITDRDITIRATAEHRNPDSAVVQEAMSPRSSSARRMMTSMIAHDSWRRSRSDVYPYSTRSAGWSG